LARVSPEHLLLVGKVIRPHGLEGLLRIVPFSSSEEPFFNAGTVCLKRHSGETDSFSVSSVRPHKTILLMKLDGLDSVEQAEAYRGAEILVAREDLGPVEEDEYYWDELLHLEVFLDSGEYLGTLTQIIPTKANDIYVVRNGEREQMIPATREAIREIDLEGGKMVVSAMEGLLDLNED
jgi:16S rRNA processing protein RimM